jgi:hypothetical protein
MSKEIELSKGHKALVDDIDYLWLRGYKWHCSTLGYAVSTKRIGKKNTVIYMHALIMKTPKGMVTDHINGEKLDNRRENLRICLIRENLMNRGANSNNTSGHKGVWLNKRINKWVAGITINKKTIHLGYFHNIEDAAAAYENALREYLHDFPRHNYKASPK